MKKKISYMLLFCFVFSYGLLFKPQKAEAFAPVLIEWAAANIVANGGAFAAEQGINPTCESFLEDLQTNDLATYTYLDEAAVAGQLFMSWELSTFTQGWLDKVENGEITEFSYTADGWDDFGFWEQPTNYLAENGLYWLQFEYNFLEYYPADIFIAFYTNAAHTETSDLNIKMYERGPTSFDLIYQNFGRDNSTTGFVGYNPAGGTSAPFEVEITQQGFSITDCLGNTRTSWDFNVPFYGLTGSAGVSYGSANVLNKNNGTFTIPVSEALTVDPERAAPSYITNNIVNHYVVPGEGETWERVNTPDVVDDPPPIAYPDTTLDQTILNKILTQLKTATGQIGAIPGQIAAIPGQIAQAIAVPFTMTLTWADVFGPIKASMDSKFPGPGAIGWLADMTDNSAPPIWYYGQYVLVDWSVYDSIIVKIKTWCSAFMYIMAGIYIIRLLRPQQVIS